MKQRQAAKQTSRASNMKRITLHSEEKHEELNMHELQVSALRGEKTTILSVLPCPCGGDLGRQDCLKEDLMEFSSW